MNDQLTKELTAEMERDLGVSLPLNKLVKPSAITHTVRIDEIISELQMTIRILEEAKKRL
jgi:hypothetical protein